ncbi:hypothetical protein PT974_05884 [Cladobotryum mycophilum]|uniref:Uncharacterized protein n=1 Tax=Cladobotryum mycophilum TaxID=491253 RepID=A0ABR0SKR4_9HYPO
MVKPLSFKGDKKPKKRKRAAADRDDQDEGEGEGSSSKQLAKQQDVDADTTDDDSWVSADVVTDIVGPIMIVLPTDQPSALACDPSGKVFALPIENIVDGNPATAEPHDVRQVWVANRISNTEHFRLKGHHGNYIPLETWSLVATADTPGTFQFQTLRDTLVTIKPSTSSKPNAPLAEIRGDADGITFNTTLRIRMQARFKPRIKSSKEERALAKVSRRELEDAAGRRLNEDEVRVLKRAKKDGDFHERLLEIKGGEIPAMNDEVLWQDEVEDGSQDVGRYKSVDAEVRWNDSLKSSAPCLRNRRDEFAQRAHTLEYWSPEWATSPPLAQCRPVRPIHPSASGSTLSPLGSSLPAGNGPSTNP